VGEVSQSVNQPLRDPNLIFTPCSRAILSYLVAAYGKSDELYPTDIRVRALVDQRLHFDLGTLYLRLTEYYVSSPWP